MKQLICRKKTILLTFSILFIILLMSFLFHWEKSKENLPTPQKGVLDLTEWNTEEQGILSLGGEWEFYWGRLLKQKDFSKEKPDLYVEVPNNWNDYIIKNQRLSGQGYATYRLHVKTGFPANTQLGLRIYTFSSAYNLYVNEMLVASNGKVSESTMGEKGEYKPMAVFFNTPASEFDIIVQVSNFQYARGGFWYNIYMGNAEAISSLHDGTLAKETFLLGVLVIVSMFFGIVYILLREFKYSLYFACFCISLIIAMDMVGQLILLSFLSGLSLKFVIFIWYSSFVWVLFFIILYMHELFTSKFSSAIVKIYLGVSIAFQIFFIFTPPTFYTRFGNALDFTEIVGVLCTIIIVVIGIKKGKKDGWLNIASMVIVLVTYIHDNLYWMNIISNSYGEIIYIGLFLFIFLQMVIQANRIRVYHHQKRAAELSFLQAQIKPHFLYNSINTFVSISRYDMDKARALLVDFSNYLRRSFDFKDLSQSVPLKNEIELAKAYGEIEKARFEERLEVRFEVCDELELKVPILILQPVIENAVNHGILPKPEGGCIEVSVRKEGRLLMFSVKDNGIGMEPEKGKSSLKREFGSGVGLSNIDDRLRKLYGKGLQINSSPGIGTEVSWCVPTSRKENL